MCSFIFKLFANFVDWTNISLDFPSLLMELIFIAFMLYTQLCKLRHIKENRLNFMSSLLSDQIAFFVHFECMITWK